MKLAGNYLRFVKWSDEDQCCIGYCPDLFYGGVCHGDIEVNTYPDLSGVILDEIEHRIAKGEDLPKPTVRAIRDLDFAAA